MKPASFSGGFFETGAALVAVGRSRNGNPLRSKELTMKFVAFERAKQGTGASRRLRITGKTPGIVYGGDSQLQNDRDRSQRPVACPQEGSVPFASCSRWTLDGAVSKVLLRDVQYHPFRQLVQHIDFQRVDAKTRMTMKVPLHFKGEEESEAVKIGLNLVNHVTTELEVNCLPARNCPSSSKIDLSGLKKNGTVTLKDIKLPKRREVGEPRQGEPGAGLRCRPCRRRSRSAPVEGAAEAAAAAAPAGKGGKPAPAAKTPGCQDACRQEVIHFSQPVSCQRPASCGFFVFQRTRIIHDHDQVVRRPGQPGPGIRSHAPQRGLLVDRCAGARSGN
jgi:large subunit ribosomal protein L25